MSSPNMSSTVSGDFALTTFFSRLFNTPRSLAPLLRIRPAKASRASRPPFGSRPCFEGINMPISRFIAVGILGSFVPGEAVMPECVFTCCHEYSERLSGKILVL